jgi:hypothetical protein
VRASSSVIRRWPPAMASETNTSKVGEAQAGVRPEISVELADSCGCAGAKRVSLLICALTRRQLLHERAEEGSYTTRRGIFSYV